MHTHCESDGSTTCWGCGAAFHCGMAGDAPCWCTRLPAVPIANEAAGCLCPACLEQRLSASSRRDPKPVPPR